MSSPSRKGDSDEASNMRAENDRLRAREHTLQIMLAARNKRLKSLRLKIEGYAARKEMLVRKEVGGKESTPGAAAPLKLGPDWQVGHAELAQSQPRPKGKWGNLFDDYDSSGDEYEGYFQAGKRNGNGIYTFFIIKIYNNIN